MPRGESIPREPWLRLHSTALPVNWASMNELACIASRDGTPIGYRRLGAGPGVLIVHGNASSHEDFLPVAELLADRFTLTLMDRRGRGLSGPQGAEYSLTKEREDIEAVLNATECKFLFGHSFGAIASLETSRHYPVSRLALYEPPVGLKPTLDRFMPDFIEAVKGEDYKRAYLILIQGLDVMQADEKLDWYLENVIMPDPVAWERLVQLIKATEKEAAVAGAYHLPDDASSLATKMLLLVGDQTPAFIRRGADLVIKAFPGMEVVTLEGQGHTAQATAPDLLAGALASFFG